MTTRKLAVIMDPIERIHPEKDTTFALMLEAQKRGWEIYYLPQEQLYLDRHDVFGDVKRIALTDTATAYYQLLSSSFLSYSLRYFDVILMRKDPPVDYAFLYTTYLLDIAKKNGCFIVNDPHAIRDANEKMFTAWFPQCCPDTLVTSRTDKIISFLTQHQKIIIKPLNRSGGHGVFYLSLETPNTYAAIELLTEEGILPIMAQRYIPDILLSGDKRILMIAGEPYPYVLARLPKSGDIRGNIHAGASVRVQAISERERVIAHEVGATLRQKGLFFVGLDVIGDYLTEINVTSPTGVREIDAQQGVNISADFWDKLEPYILSPK